MTSCTRIHQGPADGGLIRSVYSWVLTGADTSFSVNVGYKRIKHVSILNKKGNRATMAVDWTTTPGTISVTGLTALDEGTMEVLYN